MVSTQQVADYLGAYALRYRQEYETLVSTTSHGIGGPPYPISAYLNSEWAQSQTDQTIFKVLGYPVSWVDLIQRLTFGAFGAVLDLGLPSQESDLWNPTIVRSLGFCTADRSHKRFFDYLELAPHIDYSAWDLRSIDARIGRDIQRDYTNALTRANVGTGGFILGGRKTSGAAVWLDPLSRIKAKLTEFERLLQSSKDEADYQRFLQENPFLLDVYGKVASKPRFHIPPGSSLEGKAYLEPDFVIRCPEGAYKLVELESPGKPMTTKSGRPRSEVTQPAFQIAQWRRFIQENYQALKESFPGLTSDCATMIVIGRSTDADVATIREVYAVDEVLTYDDLLARAKAALARVSSGGSK